MGAILIKVEEIKYERTIFLLKHTISMRSLGAPVIGAALGWGSSNLP